MADSRGDTQLETGSNQVVNLCVICKQSRDYELYPLAVLENNPTLDGGVCHELNIKAGHYRDIKNLTCFAEYQCRTAEESVKRERRKWPTGRPPTETEELTIAIKELTTARAWLYNLDPDSPAIEFISKRLATLSQEDNG